MEFFTAYNCPPCVPCPHGDDEQISYIEVRDPQTGISYLEESDRIDIKEYINSFLEETKIDTILQRCLRGDDSALNRMQGFYADVSNVPTSIAEIYTNLKRCENNFNLLPAEMKEAFNNDPGQFIAGFGNGKVAEFFSKSAVSSAGVAGDSTVKNTQEGVDLNVPKSE